jgi:hypothetical protein
MKLVDFPSQSVQVIFFKKKYKKNMHGAHVEQKCGGGTLILGNQTNKNRKNRKLKNLEQDSGSGTLTFAHFHELWATVHTRYIES